MFLIRIQNCVALVSFLCLTACASSGPPGSGVTTDADQNIDTSCLVMEKDSANLELKDLAATGAWGSNVTRAPQQEERPKYDFPVVINPQVQMYIDRIQGKQRRHYAEWFERSGKYIPMMEEEFKKRGLPLDLVYLSMIESGYDQRAYSSAAAVGLWQFMKGTGKMYDLKINRYVDERRNALKSTEAAAEYLSDLYEMFGDWPLAVASYNAGPGKIRSGLKKYKVDNFWDLAGTKHLRLETKSYVPKLIATIIVARNPEKYGFKNLSYDEPLSYESIKVGPNLSLDAIATITGTKTTTIKNLNHELRGNKTPANTKEYAVNIPEGTKLKAKENLPRLHSMVSTGYKIHIVRKGESPKAIARKYNINQMTLAKVNGFSSPSRIKNGARLKIPYSTIKYQLLPKGNSNALAAYKDSLILHTIKKGESVSQIARKYKVPSELIVSWNGLSSVNKIRAGQQLALYIDGGKNGGNKTKSGKKLIVAQNKKHIKVEATNMSTKVEDIDVVWYLVQNGDSLWTISQKFNVSPVALKQINNLNSNLILPGSRLKVAKG